MSSTPTRDRASDEDQSTPPIVSEPVSPTSPDSSAAANAELDLFEACKCGNLEKVKELLTKENVNSRDSNGRKSTPLHFAAGTSDR